MVGSDYIKRFTDHGTSQLLLRVASSAFRNFFLSATCLKRLFFALDQRRSCSRLAFFPSTSVPSVRPNVDRKNLHRPNSSKNFSGEVARYEVENERIVGEKVEELIVRRRKRISFVFICEFEDRDRFI